MPVTKRANQKKTPSTKKSKAKQKMQPTFFQIAFSIAFYWVVSISLVFLNKMLLASFGFPYPLLITSFQLFITSICLAVLGTVGQNLQFLSFIPPYSLNAATAFKILPLTVTFVGMVTTSNLCLQYVNVSFYQVARSLTICFSIVLSYIVLGKKTSMRACLASLIVVVGFAIGAKGEIELSVIGLFFGVTSSLFVASYSILVKQKLALLDHNHWRLLAYNSALAVPLMAPIAFYREYADASQSEALSDPAFWSAMSAAALLGFLISIAVFMQINYTSALTNNISGTVKAAVQTILAIFIFQDKMSFLNACGIALVLGGSAFYSFVRLTEMGNTKKDAKK